MRHLLGLLLFLAGNGAAQDLLAAHNAVRARLSLAPLVWSDRLAKHAQEWADNLLARGEFGHRPNLTYGENLYEIRGAAATPARVVGAWAAESKYYDYRSNKCQGVCGHYTQIIWRDTTAVGCAVARGRGREVWVCDYDPPGNWIGKRPY